MKCLRLLTAVLLFAAVACSTQTALNAQELPWSVRAANSAMERWPGGNLHAGAPAAWTHDLAALLAGMQGLWLQTADPRDLNYIRSSVDPLVGADGSLSTMKPEEHKLTDYQLGRQLLLLYRVTHDQRYRKAATLLYEQLSHQQPRTPSGGLWQSQANPDQMTPDGIDEAAPFYAAYAHDFHHPEAFADVTRQFVLLQEHARDPKTGLMHQGWDESKKERWADEQTGRSPEAWGRGMGWYMAALVEALPSYPANDPGRKQLIAILNSDAAAVVRYQDADTGLWFRVVDKAGEPDNFPEASASCLFVYALTDGVRHGYLPAHYLVNAERGYKGILSHFISVGPGDSVSVTGTVGATDLGGNPYHDGSYAFYTGEKTVINDPKGVGLFILASLEVESAHHAKPAHR